VHPSPLTEEELEFHFLSTITQTEMMNGTEKVYVDSAGESVSIGKATGQ